jgi:hypothetical protein
LYDHVGDGKIIHTKTEIPKTECVKYIDDSLCIIRFSLHEDVEISGKPRSPVECQRVCADNRVLNAPIVE